MELRVEYNLDETLVNLVGPTKEQIIVYNQWAATALNLFHEDSKVILAIQIDDKNRFVINLKWNSDFSYDAMKERKKMAEDGGVSLAMFMMSVLLDYKYVHQSEIGEGVDYRFKKEAPTDDNFLQAGHFVEVSGILEESPTNNLKTRMKSKHQQIVNGSRNDEKSSVIITVFEKPFTIKEIHI